MLQGELSVAVRPSAEPVSLAEAKAHLRVDGADEDGLIERLITAARELCETEARRAFVTRTYEQRLPAFPPAAGFRLPMPPLQGVASIQYTDEAGAEGTIPEADYVVYADAEPGLVVLKPPASWPSVSLMPGPSVVIRYTAGYGPASSVPPMYKQAILLVVGHLYENREAVVVGGGVHELPMAVTTLLQAERVSWW